MSLHERQIVAGQNLNLSEKIDIILNEEKADPGIRMSKGILNR